MLEQTIALVREEAHLADALATVLCGPVLRKPTDHKGGPETDMFDVRIDVTQAQAIHCLVRAAAMSGRRLTTQQRGLGGFDAAWRSQNFSSARQTPTDQINDEHADSPGSRAAVDPGVQYRVWITSWIIFAADAIYHNISGTGDRSRRDSCRGGGIHGHGQPRRLASPQRGRHERWCSDGRVVAS
jgi:hypothetical protein